MLKLTDVLDKYRLSGKVLAGLAELSNEEKALDIWEHLENDWKFVLNHHVTRRIGQCRYPDPFSSRYRRFGEIEIHGLLMNRGREAARDNTILHEVAHAVNKKLFGVNDAHGPNWKRIMRAFGLVPERCNTDKELSNELLARKVAKSKLMYKCQLCEHEFPAMRKKKYPAAFYKHKRCGGKLYLQRDAMGRTYSNPKDYGKILDSAISKL